MKKLIFFWSALAIMGCNNDDAPNKTENTAPIAQNMAFSVDEYLTSDILGVVEATDAESDELTFAITSQDPADAMIINSENGSLYVQNPAAFDFEKSDMVTAMVAISDGSLITTVEVEITVNDVPGPSGNLLAYYPFNNDMNDYSGNGHHVVNSSASGLAVISNRFGKPDSAMEFNEGFMSIPSFGNNISNFSISAWVYKDMSLSPGSSNVIVSKVGTERDFVIKFDGDKINSHYYRGAYYHQTTPNNVPLNEWVNVILTVENGNIWSVYINGNLEVSNTNTNASNWTSNPIVIGALEDMGGEYFKGKIDDLLIYDRVLNAADIYGISRNNY